MRVRRLSKALAVVLAVGLGLVFPAGVPDAGGEPAEPGEPGASGRVAEAAAPAGEGAVWVTLLTGDRVLVRTVDGELVPHVEPAAGREDIRFDVERMGEQLHVVPSDARALIGSGRLDRRLFDVAALVAFGYDDDRRDDLPLILQGAAASAVPGDDDVPSTRAASAGGETVPLPAADALGLHQPKDRTGELWDEIVADAGAATLSAGVGRIWLDGMRQPSLDVSVAQIGAPEAWEAGYTGAGVDVAVLDTGIDATHPDLAGSIAATENFTEDPDAVDRVGHGTHVASTIVGSGSASGGQYRGVAPDAQLHVGKVCVEYGCAESWILAGMQWAAGAGADVVNMSLGGVDTPELDPIEQAVDTLSAQTGTLFVVAAGNHEPGTTGPYSVVSSPASADQALAVGAVDDEDQLADFSNQGPRVGDVGLKPEITAPGVGIVAARAAGTEPWEPVGEHYASMDGTSMASPHVAGSAALLAQQHPDWTGAQLKAALVGSAHRVDGTGAFQQGAGRVDVARAVDQLVYASPAAVSAGRQAWPHDDDEPVRTSISYENRGAEPVTMQLTTPTLGPDGGTAPEGMFRLSEDTVTVPAGGQATVDVFVDTTVGGPDGLYSGWVVAASGAGTVVTTPVGVDKEVESYDLTLVHRDLDGQPAVADGSVHSHDRVERADYYDPDGTVTLRLPRGNYDVDTLVVTPRGDASNLSLLVQPLLELSGDTTIELDARESRPFDVGFERDGVAFAGAVVSYIRRTSSGGHGHEVIGFGGLEGFTTGHFGPEVGRDEMVSWYFGTAGVTDADGGLGRSERVYSLAWYEHGRMMTGLTRHVRDGDLATVHADYRATGEGRGGVMYSQPRPVGGRWDGLGLGLGMPVPFRRVELYNTDGVVWSGGFFELAPDPEFPEWPVVVGIVEAPDFDLRAGRPTRMVWNAGVLGPAVVPIPFGWCAPGGSTSRLGDTVAVNLPLYTDAAGHPGCASSSGRTTLLRDGEVVDETSWPGVGEFAVPAEAATYRLEAEHESYLADVLSSRVSAAWTFESGHVAGDEPELLPLMAVRFAPRLDRSNRAPAGERFTIPLRVDTQGDVARLSRRPRVEVSYDDGATWIEAQVGRQGGGRFTATVQHPSGPGYVSLRATATDRDGNEVEQTIIHAYRLA